MPNYADCLEKNTDIVKNKRKRSQTILIATYTGIWAFAFVVFWLFSGTSDAMEYSIVFHWTILPVAALVISLLIVKKHCLGKRKWLLPIAFGIMQTLAEYATFGVKNMISTAFAKINIPNFEMVLIGALFSAVGLAIGKLIDRTESGNMKKSNNAT